ncbi:helix-turn-helix domain-containing protein [Streptomyces sp. SH5]|uniref:helix-turn-helix domain-containing protein n=1 Tax=Streptomyces sp. SH5 TaxID=3041765 RepID=UPI002477ECA3|nr:helix-turn-helix domain-containing protein [Streptomyces sp. SH5]WGP10205.1 helix-turn-helix domain-containing protein [Streptomyces sp. SH5]
MYNDFLVVEHVAELLRERPTTLGEPYSRHLGDGVRELRFSLGRRGGATRVPYGLAPEGEGEAVMVSHARWKLARDERVAQGIAEDPEVERRREEISLAFDLGQAVYDRRTSLGISQTELARRAGMTQPQVSKLELGGTVPTVPLLARLARAMEAMFRMELFGSSIRVTFTDLDGPAPEGTDGEPPATERVSAPAAEAEEADTGTERTAATG